MDGRPTGRTRRQTGGSAREGDARRRGQQPRSGHGARPGRHRDRHRARHAHPGVLRSQRRPVPARLRLRRAGLSDAVLQRSRGGAGSRPHRAAAQARPRCRMAVRHRRRRHAHRHRAGRHARLVVRAGRRLHRRTAKCAGLHRGADGAAASTCGSAAGSRVCAPRVAGCVGVDTSDGPIDTEHVVLTGGPKLAEVGATRGFEGACGRSAAPGGGHRAGDGVRCARRADGVRPAVRNLLAARRSRRPAVGHEQPRRSRRALRPTSTRSTTRRSAAGSKSCCPA